MPLISRDRAAWIASRLERIGLAADPGAAVAVLKPGGIDRCTLTDALDRESFYVIELPDADGAAEAPRASPPVENGFYLSLTTGTAFGSQCAVAVCDALSRRGGLAADRRSSVELCLHEAVANAIVHGNLGVPSAAKDRPEGFRAFSRLVDEGLRDHLVRERRVDVFARWGEDGLVIAVLDDGNGFDAAHLVADGDENAHSGRGFLFMRALAAAVTVTDGGRCTILHFDR